ncbi:hypothetical protein GCM10011409_00240 [Lentibacillus populi]|uniref:Siphovirus-type tail component C-terminal domain-containing protein n=1 Tax=Lentibacillus populi TaxID=1827502 RepID=A0A9W5TUJ0_9BACI|nr:distal tail protein Dit [Lentibacillus populi]GGB26878.1 hypothetical protein GCM10011409_00240 [Lentibacillus populi]
MLYNGVDMSEYMRIIDIRGRGIANQELTTLRVTGSDEDYVSYRQSPTRYIEVDYEIRGKGKEGLRKKVDAVSSIIVTSEKVPVIFPDEPDMTYFCELAGVEESQERPHIGVHRGTITLLRDKGKYGPEKTHEFTSDADIITNEGTAEADPIFELEVKKSVTFAMVQNDNEEYMMIGTPTDVEEEVIDTKALLLEERGQSLDTWSDTPTAVDGSVSGTLGTDNDGITVPSYGTDTNDWHGPALIKDIPAIQDFEIEMMAQGRTTNTAQTFRVEFYLFDEGMNVLGKMAIMDNSRNIYRKKAEGRVGPFVGKYQNYLIDSRNYSYDGWDFYYGMLRMRRVGNQFEFYVTRINNNNKHVYSLKETFTDNDNQYMGKLKYVQIHIGKYGDTPRAYAPKINHIKVYELNQATVDQTPYIAYPGDIITFDHKDDEILINGEDRKDLKDFGGSFFKLQKGDNQLIAQPSDSFNTKVTYRNRYR